MNRTKETRDKTISFFPTFNVSGFDFSSVSSRLKLLFFPSALHGYSDSDYGGGGDDDPSYNSTLAV